VHGESPIIINTSWFNYISNLTHFFLLLVQKLRRGYRDICALLAGDFQMPLSTDFGSFGYSVVKAICGVVLQVEPAKRHHIFTPSEGFQKLTDFSISNVPEVK